MPNFSTCVIGGGAAGIITTLSLRSLGSMVTCFEVGPGVGGLWNSTGHDAHSTRHRPNTPVYPSMRCVLPKDFMAFSDHSFGSTVPQFAHHSAVRDYLHEMAVRKGVHALTRFNTRVIKVEWVGESPEQWQEQFDRMQKEEAMAAAKKEQSDIAAPGDTPIGPRSGGAHNAVVISGIGMHDKKSVVTHGRSNYWRVRTANVITGDVHDWTFDSVVVCAGRHHRPRYPGASRAGPLEKPDVPIPPLPGQEHFELVGGTVRHSSEFKNFRDWTGKTVIVVGDGIGAMEHVAELQRHGAFVLHSKTHGARKKRFAPPEEAGDLSLPSRRAANTMRNLIERYNKLNETAVVRDILRSTRDVKASRDISLSAFFGQDSDAGAEVSPESLASQVSQDPTLLGRYMPVPTVGGIRHFDGRDLTFDLSLADDSSSSSSSSPSSSSSNSNNNNNKTEWHPSHKRHYPVLKYLEKAKKSYPSVYEKLSRKITFDAEAGELYVSGVDAVVFATGYFRDYGFMADPEIRAALEGDDSAIARKPLAAPASAAAKNDDASQPSQPPQPMLYHDLYMGTVFRKNPTLGVIGLQTEIIPPFLIFEAQARFVAFVLSRRIALPPPEEMDETERGMLGKDAQLVLASPSGVGVGASAAFYNGLNRLCGLSNSLAGYYETMYRERRWSWFGSGVMRVFDKARQLKPHKRKKQHEIISNLI